MKLIEYDALDKLRDIIIWILSLMMSDRGEYKPETAIWNKFTQCYFMST